MALNLLIEEKHPQTDLFICDVGDAILKDIVPHMEHPFYSLSKKPELSIRKYQHGKNWIEITPSVKGMATIYDKDVLIFAISQIMAKVNKGGKVSRRIKINTHDLLKFCNRGTAGKDYKAICEAIDRLSGTRISTNVVTGDREKYSNFGLIDSGSVDRKNGLDGRLLGAEITLSEWVFDAIQDKAVLTLNRDYFRLRKPIERRVYEIARKHCGQQGQWSIGLEKLYNKSGSKGALKHFKSAFKNTCSTNHLPDYIISFDEQTEIVTFKNRSEWWDKDDYNKSMPCIKESITYETAKLLAPNGIDIYSIEHEWLDHWKKTGRKDIKNPDKAFLGFLMKKYPND